MEASTMNITAEILRASVSKEHAVPKENIQIENVSTAPGSKVGEGFACDITAIAFEAIVDGVRLEKKYVAKCAPVGSKNELLRKLGAFEAENQCYTFTIPKLQELRASKNLQPLAFAKCFYSSRENEMLIMENLKAKGYEVIVKKPEALTINTVKILLNELAAFHATGHYFVQAYPGGKEALQNDFRSLFGGDFFDERPIVDDMMVIMIEPTFRLAVEVVRRFGSDHLAQKMVNFEPKVAEVMKRILRNESHLKFLVHGDAWFNNFLFRFPDSDRLDSDAVKIIDLQTFRYGRPGVELVYFFCSSTSPQQRKDHLDELLRFYYDRFYEELKSLGDFSDPFFSLEDLKQEFDFCYPFGFVMGCMHSQGLLIQENSEAKLDFDIFENESESVKMFENLKNLVLKNAEQSEKFRNLFLGLANEAEERNVF